VEDASVDAVISRLGIIRRRAELGPPLPGQPGPFSLGSEGVLAAAFEQARSATFTFRP
jgi:hypothetical protein